MSTHFQEKEQIAFEIINMNTRQSYVHKPSPSLATSSFLNLPTERELEKKIMLEPKLSRQQTDDIA